jgi:hypothetical protein
MRIIYILVTLFIMSCISITFADLCIKNFEQKNGYMDTFTKDISDWLRKNPNIDIKFFTQNRSDDKYGVYYAAMIIYVCHYDK